MKDRKTTRGRRPCPPRDAARYCAAIRKLIDTYGKKETAEKVGVSERALDHHLRGDRRPSRRTIGRAGVALGLGAGLGHAAALRSLLFLTVAEIETLGAGAMEARS